MIQTLERSHQAQIPTLTEIKIGEDMGLKIFAADSCNPLICGSNIPCQSEPSLRGIDSIAVFTADNKKIVNAFACNQTLAAAAIQTLSWTWKSENYIEIDYTRGRSESN